MGHPLHLFMSSAIPQLITRIYKYKNSESVLTLYNKYLFYITYKSTTTVKSVQKWSKCTEGKQSAACQNVLHKTPIFHLLHHILTRIKNAQCTLLTAPFYVAVIYNVRHMRLKQCTCYLNCTLLSFSLFY